MKLFKTLVVLVLVGMAIAAAVIWSGIYNVGADAPHWSATHRALEVARKRSIAACSCTCRRRTTPRDGCTNAWDSSYRAPERHIT